MDVLKPWPPLNRSTEELIYKNWTDSGLLEGFKESDARQCSLLMERATQHINNAKYHNCKTHQILKSLIYPCIRKIFKQKKDIQLLPIISNLNAFIITNEINFLNNTIYRTRYGMAIGDLQAEGCLYFCDEYILLKKDVLLDFVDYADLNFFLNEFKKNR